MASGNCFSFDGGLLGFSSWDDETGQGEITITDTNTSKTFKVSSAQAKAWCEKNGYNPPAQITAS